MRLNSYCLKLLFNLYIYIWKPLADPHKMPHVVYFWSSCKLNNKRTHWQTKASSENSFNLWIVHSIDRSSVGVAEVWLLIVSVIMAKYLSRSKDWHKDGVARTQKYKKESKIFSVCTVRAMYVHWLKRATQQSNTCRRLKLAYRVQSCCGQNVNKRALFSNSGNYLATGNVWSILPIKKRERMACARNSGKGHGTFILV